MLLFFYINSKLVVLSHFQTQNHKLRIYKLITLS